MAKLILSYTQNRELSWLSFNQRVLEETQERDVPLWERLKFLAIFTSNLDEFFMIRVGSLYDMAAAGEQEPDSRSGMTPAEQLEKIYQKTIQLSKKRDRVYWQIIRDLKRFGIFALSPHELDGKEQKFLRSYFREQILPFLSPQIVDISHPFPHLANKEIYLIATLHSKEEGQRMGLIPVPRQMPEVVPLPGDELRFLRLENILLEYLDLVFDKYQVTHQNYICVTRNADLAPDEDDSDRDEDEDVRCRMKKILHNRRRMAVVRLECAAPLEDHLQNILCKKCKIHPEQIVITSAPLKLGYVFSMEAAIPTSLRQALLYPPFHPQRSLWAEKGKITKQILLQDRLLSYPFESMEPFLQWIRESAYDPAVITIKITIYRLAKKARLVDYLCAAAENGKEVTVLIELRARFDEQNNIDWSERLEDAGCQVVYGFPGYKVHSKICLVIRKTRNGVEYLTQIGTGNYNEKTAEQYTDLALLTADPEIGRDAASFFKNMAVGNLKGSYSHLLVSPFHLKQTILFFMEEEIAKGTHGRILLKMNSLTDYDILVKLAEASKAGVQIDLIIRGICCILPGIEGQTEHIRVTSIVGRFLEHSRIFRFGSGSNQRLYLGSADLMTRNTERRVEIACPIRDPVIRQRVNHMLDVLLQDNVKARQLDKHGNYLAKPQLGAPVSSQEYFRKEAVRSAAYPPERAKERRRKPAFNRWLSRIRSHLPSAAQKNRD